MTAGVRAIDGRRFERPEPSANTTFSRLEGVLERLQVATYVRMGGNLDAPQDVGLLCQPFFESVDQLRGLLDRPDRKISLSALSDARESWRQCRPDIRKLGERYTRLLCSDELTGIDPAFVHGLSRRGDLHQKRRWLESLIAVYLNNWRRMDEPQRFERLLTDAIRGFQGRSQRIDKVRSMAAQLFSPKAASFLASVVVTERKPVSEVLEPLAIAENGALGRAVAGTALKSWSDELVARARVVSQENLTDAVQWGIEHLFLSAYVEHSVLASVVEMLILWPHLETSEELREMICSAILGHPRLGDPRLVPNKANWAGCSDVARERVIRWLSRHDLAFFFDFVMDQTDDPHGRKAFWSRYIDQVADCSVALSPLDVSRFRVQVRERVHHSKVTGTDNVSAFLMRFRGAMNLIVVEFSQPGNALYVHEAEAFEAALPGGIRRPSFHLKDELKRGGSMDDWVPHQSGWEYRMADILARYGIRPR